MTIRQKLDKLLGQYHHYESCEQEEQESLIEARQKVKDAEESQRILQEIGQVSMERCHSKIADVVTTCLKSVFGPSTYDFKIIFEQKRGKTEARLVFLKHGYEHNPLTESGGGCADIAGLALRLACLVLSRPQKRRVLILDEPFKGISPSYRPLVAPLLEELAERMNCQFIYVTNILEYLPEQGTIINLDQLKPV